MSIISLSKSLSETFPTQINGYEINADFKNILRILRMTKDPDISRMMKSALLIQFFYIGDAPENAVDLFYEFISNGKDKDEREDEQDMDFEFDADEIYSDFLREYRIDLLDSKMHWYKFLALLAGLNKDCALYSKIHLRNTDLSLYKGIEADKMYRAKESVQIPEIKSAADLQEEAAFVNKWEKVGV